MKVLPFVISLATAGAQEGIESRVKALILSPGEQEMKISLVSKEGGTVSDPLLIGNMGLSEAVTVVGRNLSLAIPDKSVESGYRSVGEATLPPAGGDFIILLEPAGKIFRTHVVNGKLPGFGRGDTLFFNATNFPLGATLGTRKITIPPRKPVAGGPSARGRDSWYQITFYQPDEGGGVRKFGDTRWPYRDHARAWVFFYPNGPFNGVSYHVVDEMMGDQETE